jgi:hypothetical protein
MLHHQPPAIIFFQFSDTKILEGFSEEIGKIVEFTPEQKQFFSKTFPNFPKKQKHSLITDKVCRFSEKEIGK